MLNGREEDEEEAEDMVGYSEVTLGGKVAAADTIHFVGCQDAIM